jgi:hypothetical protein
VRLSKSNTLALNYFFPCGLNDLDGKPIAIRLTRRIELNKEQEERGLANGVRLALNALSAYKDFQYFAVECDMESIGYAGLQNTSRSISVFYRRMPVFNILGGFF